MKYLLNALKEHWQVYVGLFLGLIIGLLIGVGFVDWNTLVKGAESKITDWIMAGCTFFVLIGTWKAASYAKKAAHQAQIQNNNAIISKLDDLYKDLGSDFEEARVYINKINNECEYIIENEFKNANGIFQYEISILLKEFLKFNTNEVYKYKFFIEYIIGYKKINVFYSVVNEIKFIENNLSFLFFDINNVPKSNYVSALKNHAEEYIELMDELLEKINDKYQELNGSS